jgi:hypothetical protein
MKKQHTVKGIKVRCEILQAGSAPEIRCKAKGQPAKTYRGSAVSCVDDRGYLEPDTQHAAELYVG